MGTGNVRRGSITDLRSLLPPVCLLTAALPLALVPRNCNLASPIGCCCVSAVRPEAPLVPIESTRPAARRWCPLVLLLCSRLCAVMSSGDRAARCVRGGGLDAFCLLGFLYISPTFARHPQKTRGKRIKRSTGSPSLRLHVKKLQIMSHNKKKMCYDRLFKCFPATVCPFLGMHEWCIMNGGSEAALNVHKTHRLLPTESL